MTSGNQEPFQWLNGDLRLRLHIQPGAKRHAVSGRHGDRIRLRLAAPPVDGKANRALIEFLAGEFGVARRAVRVLAGRRSRQKTVRIDRPASLPDWFREFTAT